MVGRGSGGGLIVKTCRAAPLGDRVGGGGRERAEKSERLPQRCDAVSVDRYIWPRHRRVGPEKDGGNSGLVNTVGSGSGWVLRSGGGVVFCPLVPLLE